jgi:hypothetical protein
MLRLDEIHDLARRFVPATAADRRLYESGPHSWWPAHEIGHFLVATRAECHEHKFGIDAYAAEETAEYRYMIIREIAAISISQRLLRRSGRDDLADEEIQYTDEGTLDCSFEPWCQRAVRTLLRANHVMHLPTTLPRLEALLARKAREVNRSDRPVRAPGADPSRSGSDRRAILAGRS